MFAEFLYRTYIKWSAGREELGNRLRKHLVRERFAFITVTITKKRIYNEEQTSGQTIVISD